MPCYKHGAFYIYIHSHRSILHFLVYIMRCAKFYVNFIIVEIWADDCSDIANKIQTNTHIHENFTKENLFRKISLTLLLMHEMNIIWLKFALHFFVLKTTRVCSVYMLYVYDVYKYLSKVYTCQSVSFNWLK